MRTHDRGVTGFARLVLGCVAACALPGTALAAAPATVSGPASVLESKATVEYTIECGTTANVVPGAPDVPSTGELTYATEGPGEDVDYKKTAGTVNCTALPGGGTHKVEVPIVNDSLDEPNETFSLGIGTGALFSGSLGAASAPTAIVDDDVPTAQLVQIVRLVEGDSGFTPADLTVTLSQSPVEAVTIPYSTQADSAAAGMDFTAAPEGAAITIPAGQTSGTISIPVVGDRTVEPAEAFYVNLGTPTGATVDAARSQGAVAIYDNDPPPVPAFSLAGNVHLKEGDTGVTNALFTVSLSSAAAKTTQVGWKTLDWTATSPDYAPGRGVLTFQPGQTSRTISIEVKGDRRREGTEAFGVLLESPVGATLDKKAAIGVIEDDDRPAGPKVAITSPLVEGRTVALLLACPAAADGCKGTLTARAGRTKVGRGRFNLAKGTEGPVVLKLSRRARRLLRKGPLRVRFRAVSRDPAGTKAVSVKKFTLRRPQPKGAR